MTVNSSSAQPSGSWPAGPAAGPTPPGFGPQPPAGWPASGPGPAYPGAAAMMCRHCGASPAAPVTFRLHQGVLVLMRFHKMEGPFCRGCGTSFFREMTARTLWQGWWSPLSLVLFTPFTLIANRVALGKVNRLPEPTGGHVRLQTGAPVLKRATSLAVLLPVAWLIWVIANIINDVTS